MNTNISTFRHLYPFRSNFLDIDGFSYHYLDEGQGNPLVMLHGNPTWSFYYRNLVNGLSASYRTIVPDHIGCGLSDKPEDSQYDYRLASRVNDLEFFLDSLGIQKNITLIVHDWGGMIGMAFAVRHPERISRIVITNTAAFLKPAGKPLPLRLRLIRNVLPLAVPVVLGLNAFSLGAVYMASRRGLERDVKKGLTAPYNSWKNRIATLKFVQDIPLFPEDPSYRLAASVDGKLSSLAGVPMLILWGKHDFVFDTDYFSEWCRRFPNAENRLFHSAGHYLLEDEPHETLAAIQTFLHRNPIST